MEASKLLLNVSAILALALFAELPNNPSYAAFPHSRTGDGGADGHAEPLGNQVLGRPDRHLPGGPVRMAGKGRSQAGERRRCPDTDGTLGQAGGRRRLEVRREHRRTARLLLAVVEEARRR